MLTDMVHSFSSSLLRCQAVPREGVGRGHSMLGIQLPLYRLIWLAKKMLNAVLASCLFCKGKSLLRLLSVQSKNRSFFHWIRILASHYCVRFCRITTWISHKYVYIYMCVCIYIYQRRRWHPTPVLLPGKSHGGRSLVGCSPWGR